MRGLVPSLRYTVARLMPTDLATDLQQIASLYAAEGVTLQMPVPRNP